MNWSDFADWTDRTSRDELIGPRNELIGHRGMNWSDRGMNWSDFADWTDRTLRDKLIRLRGLNWSDIAGWTDQTSRTELIGHRGMNWSDFAGWTDRTSRDELIGPRDEWSDFAGLTDRTSRDELIGPRDELTGLHGMNWIDFAGWTEWTSRDELNGLVGWTDRTPRKRTLSFSFIMWRSPFSVARSKYLKANQTYWQDNFDIFDSQLKVIESKGYFGVTDLKLFEKFYEKNCFSQIRF